MRPCALISAYGLFLLLNGGLMIKARLLTNTAELDELLECTQRCNSIPALGIALTSLNQDAKSPFAKDLLYARSYGFKQGLRDAVPTNRTLFCVGSITKHFTATLVLHLMELLQKRGFNYTVSSLVTDIIPALRFPESSLNDVTVEDILSHRTGLAETFGPFWFGNQRNATRSKLAETAAHLARVHRNREGYLYNNIVFSIAGLVAETLGEKFINATVPWESLLQEFLFQPLGIASSTGFADTIDQRRVAKPFLSVSGKLHQLDSKIMQLIIPAGPSGSLCLSPEAMATWMQFILRRGVHNGVEVVSRNTIEDSWRPRIVQLDGAAPDAVRGGEGVIASVRTGYALGWGTGSYRGFNYVGHGGGYYSYLSLLTVFPELNISIFTSTSGPATPAIRTVMRSLHLNIFDRLMGYRAVHHRFCEKHTIRIDAPRGIAKVVRHDLYAGTYGNAVFGNLTIASVREKLQLQIGRFGNASIFCWTSTTVCELKFNGILWWISDSDAFYNDRATNRSVIFELCRGRVWRVILPLYSSDVPPAFEWFAPAGSNDRAECASGLSAAVRDNWHRQGEGLQLPASSALKIEQVSVNLLLALVVFHRCFVSALSHGEARCRLIG